MCKYFNIYKYCVRRVCRSRYKNSKMHQKNKKEEEEEKNENKNHDDDVILTVLFVCLFVYLFHIA